MFHFGSPEDAAKLYWGEGISGGPGLPEGHWEEMDVEDLRDVFVYLYASLQRALKDSAPEDVIQIMTETYDEVFVALAQSSDAFRQAVKNNRHIYVTGYTKESIEKYKALAES